MPKTKPQIAPGFNGRPQMTDVARLAGVSVPTVSRALSDSPLVNAETKRRVREVARELNYVVNIGAKNLRQGTNHTVSFVIPFETSVRQAVSDPFFLSILGSVADALTERRYEMLLSRVDASELEQIAALYGTGRACGIILIGQWHNHDQLNHLAERGVPLVVWGAELPGQRYCTVGGDNRLGGKLATQRLLQRGARRVAFFGDPDLPEVAQRYQGYLDAHRDAGVRALKSLLFPMPFALPLAQRRIAEVLAARPKFDAVFAASDLLAMQTITQIQESGLRVPEDVLVVGYDDVPFAGSFNPPLTTVSQHIDQAGAKLVETLFDVMQAQGQPQTVARLLPTDLVVRQSA